MNGIFFPGLGISFGNVPSGFTVFGFEIRFYGLIIALGFILGLLWACHEAKRTGQNPEAYQDFLLIMIIPTILGARLYYIIFYPERFFARGQSLGQTLLAMINLRNGGLAIYGGIIGATLTGLIFVKKRKLHFPLFTDTISMGLLIGQILGRWGNFFNREAFGAYTDSVFRMAIPVSYYEMNGSLGYFRQTGVITDTMLQHTETVRNITCITVHPTFLYEGTWNFLLFLFLLYYRKHKKFDGEMSLIYVAGYGLGRFFVEGLRTDSLMIGPLKVSQCLGLLCVAAGAVLIVVNRIRIARGRGYACHNGTVSLEKGSEKGQKNGEKSDKQNID